MIVSKDMECENIVVFDNSSLEITMGNSWVLEILNG